VPRALLKMSHERNGNERARNSPRCVQDIVYAGFFGGQWVFGLVIKDQRKRSQRIHSKRTSIASRRTRAQRPNTLSHTPMRRTFTDTGPGALERIRAARLVAIDLNLAANEAEREAREADELDEEEYERDTADDRDPYQ
jgi:hypothetical protein